LDPYVNAFKIGSGDINWIEEIELIASKRKPIFIATGASELNEVREAVDVIQKHGVPLCLMQCNTNYSGQFSNFNYINLNVLKQYKKLFPNVILGLSDHTEGHTTVLGAIALGAKVVEKHFTDDKNRKGPDHKFSMSPKGWKEMVDRSLELQLSLGSGLKKIEMNEEESILVQRRSLRAKGNLSKGKIITRDDLTILRPAPLNSISPNKINEVLGKKLNKDVGNDENLYWGDIEI
jgi:N-acetylneuraminate synthase